MQSDTLFQINCNWLENTVTMQADIGLCRADRIEDGQEREIKPQFGPL